MNALQVPTWLAGAAALLLHLAAPLAAADTVDRGAALRAALERIAVIEARITASLEELAEVRAEIEALLEEPAPRPVPPGELRSPTGQPEPVDPPSARGSSEAGRPLSVKAPEDTVPLPPEAPWRSLGGATLAVEENDGLAIWIATNTTPGVVRTLVAREGSGIPPYPLRPRAAAAIVQGDTKAWSKRAALRAWGTESQIPAQHAQWVGAQQALSGVPRVAGYVVSWADDLAHGVPMGGGQGIPPWGMDWQRNARGLEIALWQWIGCVNREPIHADWEDVAPSALSPTRVDRIPEYEVALPEHPDHLLHAYRAHGWTHLNRVTQAALFLAEHTDLELPREWLAAYWRDAESILGWKVPPKETPWDGWYEPYPGSSHTAPFWRRMEWAAEVGHNGWLGRGWGHITRFALDLERIGLSESAETLGSPAHFVAAMKQTLQLAWEHHPRKGKPGRYQLSFGRSGNAFDGMPLELQELGHWGSAIENYGIWVRELRRLGFVEEADELAAYHGPHPQWILLIEEENAPGYDADADPPLRFGPSGWHAGDGPLLVEGKDWEGHPVLNDVTVPFLWQTAHPELVERGDLLARCQTWYGLRDHPLAYTPAERRMELLGW